MVMPARKGAERSARNAVGRMVNPDEVRVDGRRERSVRTHQRVIEAVIELVEEGETAPTAQHVAARAGISLRTVYHHFDDLTALRAEALQLAWDRHTAGLVEIRNQRSLDDRVTALVRQLSKVYEAVAPVCRAELLAADKEVSAGVTRQSRRRLRQYIAAALAPEIEAAGITGPVLLDALDAALTWQSWDYLRAELGRSHANATRTFETVVRHLLATTS